KRGRGFFRGMLYDVMMVLVMGALFLASILVADAFFWVRTVLTPGLMPRQWVRWTLLAISLAFNLVLFFMTYRYFPNRHVRIAAAIGGAVLASGLWEVAKQIFRWYILSVGVYDQIYGPLGAMVALSMFTYYSGVVVVLGAEYAAALESRWRAR